MEADLCNLPKAAELILEDVNVDGLMIIGTHLGEYARWSAEVTDEKAALELALIIKKSGKPVVCQNYLPDETIPAVQLLRQNGVPVYIQIESAVRALGALVRYRDNLKNIEAHAYQECPAPEASKNTGFILDGATREGRKALLETEAREILGLYGIPVMKGVLVKTGADMKAACEQLEFPLAAKIVSPQIIHKTDAGGVMLNLKNEREAVDAYETILANIARTAPEARIDGVLLSPMAKAGTEVIIGAVRDQQFGPVIMVGLGGIFVEVLKDVAFRVAPLTSYDARQMIGALKGKALLSGVRGEPARDIESIVDVLLKASQLMIENVRIREMDINPLFVYKKGIVALDARMILD